MIDLHFHPLRKALQLSLNEMAVLREINELSNNTKYSGWCVKSRANIADTLDLSRQTVISIIQTLHKKEYVDVDKETLYIKPTDFIRAISQERENIAFIIKNGSYKIASDKIFEVVSALQGVKILDTPPVKKLDTPCKDSLHQPVKKLDTSISESMSLSISKDSSANQDSLFPKEEIEKKKEKFPARARTIEEREKDFINLVEEKAGETEKRTVEKFCDYWTEHSPNGTKMRFEKEKVFDIKKRIKTWIENEKRFNKNNSGGGQLKPVAQRVSDEAFGTL